MYIAALNKKKMEQKVFISLTKQELQSIIVECVNECLRTDKTRREESKEDVLMTIQDAAEFLHLTVPTLYAKVHHKEIPFLKKSKRLYFQKSALIDYLSEK